MAEGTTLPGVARHGAKRLPSVDVESYDLELEDDEGFIGDAANKMAFRRMLENWRKPLRKKGEDPFGDERSEDISRKTLDGLMSDGDPKAAAVVQAAIEEFAQELAIVIRRFLKLKSWREVERIVVGGGFREGRVGELAIGRAAIILKADAVPIDLVPIHRDPDEAGLIGAAHLAPRWMFAGHDAILAVDIGGTNIRAGVIELNLKKGADRSKAAVHKLELWRHADEKKKITREGAVEKLASMLKGLISRAGKDDLRLAPFIGIGCPGVIEEDGTIDRGAQNLPGNWESKSFSLPESLQAAIPTIGKHETMVLMHNDAVVQGLSEAPFMTDVKHWGVFTIGTGLGNACFTNRASADE